MQKKQLQIRCSLVGLLDQADQQPRSTEFQHSAIHLCLKYSLTVGLCFSVQLATAKSLSSGEMITIIGPDGLPMVVPVPEASGQVKSQAKPNAEKKTWFKLFSKEKPASQQPPTQNQIATQRTTAPVIQQAPQQQPRDTKLSASPVQTENDAQVFSNTKVTPSAVEQRTQQQTVQQQDTMKIATVKSQASHAKATASQVAEDAVAHVDGLTKKHTTQNHTAQNDSTVDSSINNSATSKDVSVENEPAPYRMIDGEKYYQAEYLESKEFNVEGKKRFYQIPTPPMSVGMKGVSGGTTNWDVVEREKGVDMSVFRGTTPEPQQVVTLGVNYHVISQDELAEALPTQCIDDKAKRKSKSFGRHDSVSFFPRAPFDNRFDFELLEINQPLQNVKISSYANSGKAPSYYWPIAVFLDQKGCVIEGATAFHTQTFPATMLQSASIEGVIHIPKNSHYLLLSALESSVDVPELQLSNQGQIKLTVLR
ncbi:putative pilus assembly protein FilE [Acinetobacter marinus]|nr:putative pilus assembly protein FilE [Acinetobacter marinus]